MPHDADTLRSFRRSALKETAAPPVSFAPGVSAVRGGPRPAMSEAKSMPAI